MTNQEAWEREYQKPQLLTLVERPNQELLRFLRWLKKERGTKVAGWRVLDLGAGTGRNSNYLAGEDCQVSALEFSTTALRLAGERARERDLAVDYRQHDLGQGPYPYPDREFDLVLDITSSNSLNEKGRGVYLEEVARVLKSGGWFFVRALCKDGDKNALNLLKKFPGSEKDTYIMPDLGLTERVFSQVDFVAAYSPAFKIEKLTKTAHYAKFKGQSYRRQYWVAYLRRSW